MIRPQRYFPWKIVRHFVFNQLLFLIVALVLTGFSIRYYIYRTFVSATDIHMAIGEFDRLLTSLFWLIFFTGFIFILVSARFYLRPLGRLIQRARELRRRDTDVEEMEPEELAVEEPGEWYDLERALNRIHRDLRKQTLALEREREELSALIGAVSDAILAVDLHGTPLFFNSQFALLFGVQSSQKKTFRLGEIFRVPEILDVYHHVLDSGQAESVNTSVHQTRTGITRHFSVSVAPLKNKDGDDVYGAVGIFHDVTELKQAEQIRIEFVGNASHELRTPLTSIKGYVATLAEDFRGGRTDGAEKFLEIISRNVDRLMFLVNDLLDLSTIESGAEVHKMVVSIREVTESVLRQVETKRAGKKIELSAQYGVESLLGDGRRIEQVLVNLVQNAIQYISEGRKIEIIWEPTERGGARLRVKDNGPGIPPEHHLRLFERFYRVDTGRSREQGGTGLGLSIVKHIMIKHGGTIHLKSVLGVGSEFVCEFPA